MTTPTTNFAWPKPIIGADSDTWGTELNTIFDDIDGQVFLYLLKTGGTVSGATTFGSTLAVTGATTLTGGAASLRGVTGPVAENTLTTLFDMGTAKGTWIVSAQQTGIGDHMQTLIQPTPGGGTIILATVISSDGAGTGANNLTFAISGTIVQAKRNTGAGTGTITYSASLLQ